MADDQSQTYASHRKFVPMYHFFTAAVLLVYLIWSIWNLIKGPGVGTVMGVLLGLAFMSMFYYLRIFPLKVQDRLIRLEQQLRLQQVLPDDLKGRVGELGAGQCVALRFASDDELADLVREVLDEGITDREAIKKKIKLWNPDTFRC